MDYLESGMDQQTYFWLENAGNAGNERKFPLELGSCTLCKFSVLILLLKI